VVRTRRYTASPVTVMNASAAAEAAGGATIGGLIATGAGTGLSGGGSTKRAGAGLPGPSSAGYSSGDGSLRGWDFA